MAAWASGSEADIDAVYDRRIDFSVGERQLAGERATLLELIGDTVEAGDTVRPIGPAIEARQASGALVVATMLEFLEGTRLPGEGPGGPRQMVLLCYYRVPDELVTEQICLEVGQDEEDSQAVASADATPPDASPVDGPLVAARAMAAWASGNEADIAAAYAPDVELWIGEWQDATDRRSLQELIQRSREGGRTLRQVGPVIEYRQPSGPLMVGTMLEAAGVDALGEARADLLVCYYRVPDDLVTAQICLDDVRDPVPSQR
jgi:hypothetical protein